MSIVWITIFILCGIAVIAAVLLYVAAKKFYVYEDPRIGEVEALLPGANCGGCGKKGCHDFAVACASAKTLEGLNCPGAAESVMLNIANIVGLTPQKSIPRIAIVRCDGTCSLRPTTATYDGPRSCAIEASTFAGTTACAYGCLGCGDCVAACPYDAIHIDTETGLPAVDHSRCVGCGKCAAACPRGIITLIDKRDTLVWVACMNHDKGAVAMKECDASCIGCGKCLKTCPAKAIKITEFLAGINQDACIACGQCVNVCPHGSILIKGEPKLMPAESQADDISHTSK